MVQPIIGHQDTARFQRRSADRQKALLGLQVVHSGIDIEIGKDEIDRLLGLVEVV